jgi:hypothetical protein
VPQARQIVQKMLHERLTFRPEEREGRRGYRFIGEGNIMALLTGTVPGL